MAFCVFMVSLWFYGFYVRGEEIAANIGFGPNDIIANDNPCDQCDINVDKTV